MKIKIKTKDDNIVDGYELELTGEYEDTYNTLAIIMIPPNKKEGEDCPVIVFAKPVNGFSHEYKEIPDLPYINLYSKADLKQLIALYDRLRR